MRKNEYGPKKAPRKQPSGKSRNDWGRNKDGVSKTGSSGGSGAKRGARGSFSDRFGRDDSFENRQFDKNEGYNRPARSQEWNSEGYRKPRKGAGTTSFKGYGKTADQGERNFGRGEYRDYRESRNEPEFKGSFRGPKRGKPGKGTESAGFKGYGKTADQGERSFGRGEYRDFRESRNESELKGSFRDPKRGNIKKTPRSRINNKFDSQYKKETVELKRSFNETEINDNTEREDRVEGRNSVFEAIRSGRPLNKLFVEKDSEDVLISRIVAMAREKDIPIQYLERSKLDAISQTRTHQGVVLEVAAKEYVEVDDILEIASEKGEQPFVLVLDGITDTNNLGSIIRSAECAGVHGIILPKRRSATLNATVAKVAAGALEYVPVARVSNLVQTLRSLKNNGLWIIGTDMDGENNYHNTDLSGPTAIVIGSEGEGLARLVKDECDLMVKIPMKGKISSLNAGVAAALVMFEALRQRDKL